MSAQTDKQLCDQLHICDSCKKQCYCRTYLFACPWINDDEDRMCDPCMGKFTEEYEKYWWSES